MTSPQPDTTPLDLDPLTGPAAEGREPIIELRHVSKSYGPGSEAILEDLSLTVMPGDFVTIIGPSGSGKSTLLNILGLLDSPTTGSYLLNGQDVSQFRGASLDELRGTFLGFVFQDAHLLPQETVVRNASLPLRVQGVPGPAQGEVAFAQLSQVGLDHRLQNRGRDLSGGERQRVAIARALVSQPRVLLADEPTGNLDQDTTDQIMADLQALNRAGTTILLITHDQAVAEQGTRCLRMQRGRLQEVFHRPRHAPREHQAPTRPTGRTDRLPRRTLLARAAPYLDALASLTTRPARALVLCLAFALAATGLVASAGLMDSAAQQVGERLDAAALDEVRVVPTSPSFRPRDAAPVLAQLSRLEGVVGSGYRTALDARVTRLGSSPAPTRREETDLFAATPGYLSAAGARLSPQSAQGLFARASADPGSLGDLALVGRDAAKELGISAPGPGVTLTVQGHALSVVGIIDSAGRDKVLTHAVVVDTRLAEVLKTSDPQFLLRTRPGYPAPVAEAAPLAADPAHPQEFTVQTVNDLRSLSRGVSDDVATLSFISSWGILLMAILSAGTTMWMSVQTRRGEIALRRAVGASRGAVLRLFLAEGLFIGMAGGALGTALGSLGMVGICWANGWTPVMQPSALALGFLAGSGSGLVSAVLPALAASRARPAEAIRTA